MRGEALHLLYVRTFPHAPPSNRASRHAAGIRSVNAIQGSVSVIGGTFDSLLVLREHVNAQAIRCFIDPCSDVTMISEAMASFLNLDRTEFEMNLHGFNGKVTPVTEKVMLTLFAAGHPRRTEALGVPTCPVGDILLGSDWCTARRAMVDCHGKKL